MTRDTAVGLESASSALKPALRRLLSDYLLELSALIGVERELDASGQPSYRYFDGYWSEPGRVPFAIRVGGELAGFCLLRDTGERWSVAEFYVAPSYRRHGVGTAAVTAVKEYCRLEGRHAELEADTLRENGNARAFWLRQGFVTEAEHLEGFAHVFDLRR